MGLEFTDDIDRAGAQRRVPTAIGLGTNLLGDDDLITERLRLYRDAGVNTLRVGLDGATNTAKLDDLAHLLDLVQAVNTETVPTNAQKPT